MRSVVLVLALVVGCNGSNSAGVDSGGDMGSGDGGTMGDDDAGGGQPHSVTLTLTNRPTNAAMFSFVVAFQDGSGPWQLAPAPVGDVYTLPIHAPSYGVAYACIGNVTTTATSQIRSVTSAFFALGERSAVTLDVPARCSDRTTPMVALSGTIQNRPIGGVLTVQFGGRTAFVSNMNGAFTLQVPSGTHDLSVVHAVPQGNGDFYVDQAWIQRSVAISAATTRTIDFNNAEYTNTFGVDLGPLPIDTRSNVSTTLYTANGSTLGLVRLAQNLQTQSLADVQMITSDVYDQSITVGRTGGGATITNATNAPADQTWVPPTPLGAVQTTVPTKMPYVTLQTAWPSYAGAIGYQWNATQQPTAQACGGNTACTILWTASISPGVLGTMPMFRMPDLAALTGWKPGFELLSGTQIVGSVTALTSSAGASDFPTVTPPANGTKRTFVRADFATTP